MTSRISLVVAGLAAFVLRGAAGPPAAAPLPAAWQALSIGSYADAAEQFAQQEATRESQLGAAIALINRPPVTSSSLATARERLRAVAAGNDEAGHAARYFLGRMDQFDPFAPDPAAAARSYEELVATRADDAWCRLALVKLAILRLTTGPATEPSARRLAAAEELLSRTADPPTLRDLHVVLAEARLHHRRYDAATLAHLRAALALTAVGDGLRADLLIQVGRLAEKLGEPGVARESFARFLEENPRERRAYTVAAALADLAGGATP